MDIWLPQFYTGRFFKLFLSHTSAHKGVVGDLSRELAPLGIAAFVAHDSIGPMAQWKSVIEGALRDCEALAAYLTDDFPASNWTDQEVGAAFARKIPIIPLKVDIDPYGFVGSTQAMKAKGVDLKVLASQIADYLHTDPLTRDAMAEAAVSRFARSQSFDEVRSTFARLKRLPQDVWTPQLIDAVEEAPSNNGQIHSAEIDWKPASAVVAAFVAELRSVNP